jgi:hypothetical protein
VRFAAILFLFAVLAYAATPAERIARLGTAGNDNIADVKALAEDPKTNAGLLVAALQTIPDTERFARADLPTMEHALWIVRALRYLTGGKDFHARTHHKFGQSEEERNRKYWLMFDGRPDAAFFAYWMSRNRWYIAPVDAQNEIIAQWRHWYATEGKQFDYKPLRDPSPENWIW